MTAPWIAVGDRAPKDPAENTVFHENLLTLLRADAARMGWAGMALCHYHRENGVVGLGALEAEGWPDLDGLRLYREAERARQEQVEREQQGSLL